MNATFAEHGSVAYVKVHQRNIRVRAYLSGSESPSDTGSEIEKQELKIGARYMRLSGLPTDCLTVMKAMKYLSFGPPDACVAGLSILLEYNLLNPFNLHVVCEHNGLEILVNLCEVNHQKCRLAALSVLRTLTKNNVIARRVVNLGIIPPIVNSLIENDLDILENAISVLANIGHLRRASKAFRRTGGIPILVTMLKVDKAILVQPEESLQDVEKAKIIITCCAAEALWAFARFTKNKRVMFSTGIIIHITDILLSGNRSISIPVSGILSECSTLPRFQLAIETEGLVGVLVENMTKDDAGLQWSSSLALKEAASKSDVVRKMIRWYGGLKIVMNLLCTLDTRDLKLLTAVIGVICNTAQNEENVKDYENLGAIEELARYVDHDEIEVRIYTVGALAEMAKTESARNKIIGVNVVPKIVGMLVMHEYELNANAAHFLGNIALNPEGMESIERNDGVRLLWSLLHSRDRLVRLKALWAIKVTVTRAYDGGEQIRQLTGSLVLLVQMLKDTDVEILTAVTSVVGEVALDLENLKVLTQQGVVQRLARLVHMRSNDGKEFDFKDSENYGLKDMRNKRPGVRSAGAKGRDGKGRAAKAPALEGDELALQRELCYAISNCAVFPENMSAFGRFRVIPLLAPHLASKDPALLREACRCFNMFSRDPVNCIVMHVCDVVPDLLAAVSAKSTFTQEIAAQCLSNIRHTLIAADRKKASDLCPKQPRRPATAGNYWPHKQLGRSRQQLRTR